MGCGISKLGANAHQHHQHDHLTTSSACESNNYNIGKDPERGMHDYGEEDDMMMKEKERSGRVEKVVKERRIKEGHPHAHAHAHAGLGLGKGGRQYSDDDGYDEQMLSSSDREDSFIHCPRSPSFRDYFIDSDQDSSRHHTPNKFFFSGELPCLTNSLHELANQTICIICEVVFSLKVMVMIMRSTNQRHGRNLRIPTR